MKRLSRDTWLTIFILLILGILTIFAASQTTSGEDLPLLSSYSSAPNGGKALLLWLKELGFKVSNQSSVEFEISSGTDVVILLQPYYYLLASDQEWEVIDSWVNKGGILVLVGDSFSTSVVFDHFEFSSLSLQRRDVSITAYSPDLNSPPQILAAPAQVSGYFESTRTDYLTLMAVEEGPVTVAFEQGKGWVVLSTLFYPFTNSGLKQPGNPELVLNILTLIEGKSTVWIDEWHHGQFNMITDLAGPADWLRFTSTGRAILFVAGVLLLGVVLSGRKFGRPLPVAKHTSRRPAIEYVSSIANLKRRAGHRKEILESYRQTLKRELSSRYRFDPRIDDEEFVAALSQYDPSTDSEALFNLLNQLTKESVSEQAMVKLASEVTHWISPEEKS